MKTPSIYIGGTSKEELIEALENATNAVLDAAAAVQATGPNGRDYVTQGPGALADAIEEHISRMRRLHSVRSELMEIWGRIDAA